MSDEAIQWERFLPTEALPDTGPKTFEVGQVWAGKTGSVASVYRIVPRRFGDQGPTIRAYPLAGWNGFGGLFPDSDLARLSRLVRHADGRWADGYGPGGPVAQHVCKGEPCGKTFPARAGCLCAFDWGGECYCDYDAHVVYCSPECRARAPAAGAAPTCPRCCGAAPSAGMPCATCCRALEAAAPPATMGRDNVAGTDMQAQAPRTRAEAIAALAEPLAPGRTHHLARRGGWRPYR